jgi:hypothetical protein
LIDKPDEKQKWAYWPVRLYKAGRCMRLFNQNDYYQSLRAYANYIKNDRNERLNFFSHEENSEVGVIERWNKLDNSRSSS